ncbi:MAG: hypothetical protein ACYTG5_08260 [Planctomycetota bacterium]|jgi:hypothetical protein
MFLNDPMIYGATLPYKDVNLQAPFVPPYFAPLQNNFIPPTYNYSYTDYQKLPYEQFLGFPNFPIQQFPLQHHPIQQFPIQQFPIQQFPVQQFPIQQLPMQQFPVQQLPYQQFPFLHTPFTPPVNYNPMSVPFYGWQRPFVG